MNEFKALRLRLSDSQLLALHADVEAELERRAVMKEQSKRH